jgi:hypothetical protein
MKTGLYTLQIRDLFLGLIVAVFSAAAISVIGIFQTEGFDVFSADWSYISKLAVNGGFGGFIGYVVKNFFSNGRGEFAGKI